MSRDLAVKIRLNLEELAVRLIIIRPIDGRADTIIQSDVAEGAKDI